MLTGTLRTRASAPWKTRKLALAGSALAAVLAPSFAPAAEIFPTGSPFVVADSTEIEADETDVAMFPDGRAVVVWEQYSNKPGNARDVRGRILAANDTAVTDVFRVHSYLHGSQARPSVAVSAGRFLVAWSGESDTDPTGVSARIFDRDGVPAGPAFLLHPATGSTEERDVAAARDGDGFVVAWVRDGGVAGVRLSASGTVRGSFTQPVDNPLHVAVAGLPNGALSLLWSSTWLAPNQMSETETGVTAGTILSATNEVTRSFVLNEGRPRLEYDFVVDGYERLGLAAAANGDFTAVHDSALRSYLDDDNTIIDGYRLGARVERFDSAGKTFGSFYLADQSDQGQTADVAVTSGGNVVSVINDVNSLSDSGVFLRAFDCHGEMLPIGMTRVNSENAYLATPASVAANERGDVLVVWSERSDDYERHPVFARRYSLESGCVLCGDVDRNGDVTAIDALQALRAGVGLFYCPSERCDADGSGQVGSVDALFILRSAVSGGTKPLPCSAAPLARHVASKLFETPYETASTAVLVGSGNETLLASFDREAGYVLASRTIDQNLFVGSAQTLAELGSEDRGLGDGLTACANSSGLATAWSDYDSTDGPGLRFDLSNVFARPAGGQPVQAHANSFGSQHSVDIACLAGGRTALVWYNVCEAVEVQGSEGHYFRPDQCGDEPADGNYLQVLEADGAKSGPMRSLGSFRGYPAVAAAQGDRLVVAAGDTIEIRSPTGELLDGIDSVSDYYLPELSCVGTHCARSGDGSVTLLDVDDLASNFAVVLRDPFWFGPARRILPSQLRLNCESSGTCLATYLVEELDFDRFSREFHGIYARPFDLRSGALGEEIHLQHTDGYSYDPQVASMGPGKFVVSVFSNKGLTLHRIDVD